MVGASLAGLTGLRRSLTLKACGVSWKFAFTAQPESLAISALRVFKFSVSGCEIKPAAANFYYFRRQLLDDRNQDD
jgi:hypothetical protein